MLRLLAIACLFTVIVAAPSSEVAEKHTVEKRDFTVEISLFASKEKYAENEEVVNVTIRLDSELPDGVDEVPINYTTADGTAKAGEDYHPVYGTIKFTKYVRLYVITIYLIDNPYHEFSEFFSFWLKNLICCPILKPDHISIYIYDDEYISQGDPHFSVPLLTGEKLCYSIQGYAGLPFNLISSEHLTINALFIDSINDATEATWIGKLAIIPRNVDKSQPIIFDSVSQEVKMEGNMQGQFKASALHQIIINGSDVSVKFTRGMIKQFGNAVVKVIFTEPKAIFDVTFFSNHLDVAWQMQESALQGSHGLMGQFMVKGVEIDKTRNIMIRPGQEPVPVVQSVNWLDGNEDKATTRCWRAMNTGNQGEGLIQGSVLDYYVKEITNGDFAYKQA